MRFLFLSQGKKIEDQPDFHVSFLKAFGEDSYRNIPYQAPYVKGGWPLLEKTILEANEDFRPDTIFFQFFHAPENVHPAHLLQNLKQSSNRPLIIGSIGDLFDTGVFSFFGRPIPPSVAELASEADAFFSTTMGATARLLVKYGAKNVIFLPNAYCQEHFPPVKAPVAKEFDVIMLGRIPRNLFRQPVARIPTVIKRRYVVHSLSKAFGANFGVFGSGWRGPFAHGGVAFKDQVALFRKSKVVVDSPPRISEELYSSDRAYFIAGAGVSLVMPYTPRFELLFEPGVNVHYVFHLRDVAAVCKKVLALPEDVRTENERRTVEYIQKRNLISHRVDTIVSVLEAIQRQRGGEFSAGQSLDHLRFSHFRPELCRDEYMPYAVVNWKG